MKYWTPSLLVLLGTAGGLAYGLMGQPAYTADAHVMVVAGKDAEPSVALGYAQTYGRLARQHGTLSWARVDRSGRWMDDLRKHVRTSISPQAPVIAITGTASSPDSAAAYANATAGALINYANDRREDTGVYVTSMSPATPPHRPTSPNLPLTVAVGAVTGMVLAGLVTVTKGVK